ncbi:hypothetical protein [Sphingomonas aerophila]|uniref:Uncharacterized protein n=1 Tax=Sphingomonas aerophila TaxID=1344948 RepID=A0A7W9BH56_9SPHN|nr:hypothetical protein [Sphingomonas aerophila]MBB5716771.1 hypothetical protein [Sphingomonas aerophila]
MDTIAVSRIKVAVGVSSADGLLVLNDGALVAVFVHLEADYYGPDNGRWYLEAGFGPCAGSPRTFDTIAAALRWIAERLGLEDGGVLPPITPS